MARKNKRPDGAQTHQPGTYVTRAGRKTLQFLYTVYILQLQPEISDTEGSSMLSWTCTNSAVYLKLFLTCNNGKERNIAIQTVQACFPGHANSAVYL